SLKASFAFGLLLGCLGAYLLARDLLGWRAGLVAGIAYAYVPYRLVDVYTRGDLAEVLASAMLPLVFWGFLRVAQSSSVGRVAFAGVALCLLLVSHAVLTIFAMPLLLIFLVVVQGLRVGRRAVVGLGAAALLAAALAAGYWLPVLTQVGDLNPAALTAEFFDYHSYFIPLAQLV